MKVSNLTKRALIVRRDHRDRLAAGWEFLSEGGGKLWELHRGGRYEHHISDVAISACGKAVWFKTEKPLEDD